MKETIEAFAVYRNGGIMNYFDFKEDAEADVFHHGGTVVKLTGEMPRKLRKVSTVVWIEPCEENPNADTFNKRLGFVGALFDKFGRCTVKSKITMEELPEEGEG